MSSVSSSSAPGRFRRALLAFRSDPVEPTTPASTSVIPPRRSEVSSDPLTLVSVYRAVSIITTAAAQLPLRVERGNKEIDRAEYPGIIKQPCLDISRPDFIEQVVLSLALAGNAYIRVIYNQAGATPVNLENLNPHEVWPQQTKTGAILYHYRGKKYTAKDIKHIALMKRPGALAGLSPITAAREMLTGAAELQHYADGWFNSSGQPSGVLKTDQPVNEEEAKLYRDAWNRLNPDGTPLEENNPSRVRVLGKGLTYDPILLSPKDAQWIEARAFTTTEIARLFGVPASLMLASVEGSTMTYQNVEQDWLGFVRFTLTAYLQKIEEVFTQVIPRGQKARFDIAGLLRSDTLSRYQAHQIALTAGFMTINEVREIEALAPLPETEIPPNETQA